jgi:hypothetical protein
VIGEVPVPAHFDAPKKCRTTVGIQKSESNLGPKAAECQPTPCYQTQNKAKRASEILGSLVRRGGLGISLGGQTPPKRLNLGAGGPRFESARPDHLFLDATYTEA